MRWQGKLLWWWICGLHTYKRKFLFSWIIMNCAWRIYHQISHLVGYLYSYFISKANFDFVFFSGYYPRWLPMAFWHFCYFSMATGYLHLQICHWQFGLHMSTLSLKLFYTLYTGVSNTFPVLTFVWKYGCICYVILKLFWTRCVLMDVICDLW